MSEKEDPVPKSQSSEPLPDPIDASRGESDEDDPVMVRKDLLDTIEQSFLWVAMEAGTKLGTLKDHLKEKDAPPWSERIAAAALDVALAAGAAGIAEYIAGKLVGEVEGALGEGKKEFVKAMFEDGIGHGISFGREKLHGSIDSVISGFIESQTVGVQATQQENQRQWIQKRRHSVKSVRAARALEEACARPNMAAAADSQVQATRNAWLSYLAQSTYGSVDRYPDNKPEGVTTTDMSNQQTRDRVNAGVPGWTKPDAPTIGRAILGHSPGVLSVFVELPEIAGSEMRGEPKVIRAYLNGTNAATRTAYEKLRLSEMRIPRLVQARVNGRQPNFELSVDEQGLAARVPHERGLWLRARARVAHVERIDLDDATAQKLGEDLLLGDIIVNDIQDKGL